MFLINKIKKCEKIESEYCNMKEKDSKKWLPKEMILVFYDTRFLSMILLVEV